MKDAPQVWTPKVYIHFSLLRPANITDELRQKTKKMILEENRHVTVIIKDTTGTQNTRSAIELAARSAEEGCLLQRRNSFVEIVPIENIDDEVRNDNRLWNLLFNAHSIIFITSFSRGGVATAHMNRILRLSDREHFNQPRVSCLTVSQSYCANAIPRDEHVCNGGVNQIRQWAIKNNMTWVMDASITVQNAFINRDYDNWREVCKLVGEGVIV